MSLNIGTLAALLKLDVSGYARGAKDAVKSTDEIADALDDLAKHAKAAEAAVAAASKAASSKAAHGVKGMGKRDGGIDVGALSEHMAKNPWAKLVDHAKTTRAGIAAEFEKIEANAGNLAAVSAGALAIAAGLTMIGAKAVEAASAYDETTGKIKAVFGASNLAVEEWAETNAHAMAMGSQEARKYASNLGAVIAPMIGSQKAAAGMSTRLTQLGGDMAAAFDSSNADAVLALTSAITGETEPMKRFGVVMNDANLAAFALSSGAKKLYKDMSLAEKTQLRYNFILNQTALIQGTAARELKGFSGQLRLAKGLTEDLAVAVGQPLKNAVAPLLAMFNELTQTITNASPWLLDLAAKAGIVAVGILGAVGAVTGLAAAVGGLTIIWPALVAGFGVLFSTILPVIVIIGTLIIVTGLLYKAWQDSSNGIQGAAGELATGVVNALKALYEAARTLFTGLVSVVVNIGILPIQGIWKVVDLQLAFLQNVLGRLLEVAKALGVDSISNKISGALKAITGGRATVAFEVQGIEDLRDNLIEAFDPGSVDDLLGKLGNAFGKNGFIRQGLVEAGGTLVEAMKEGVAGAAELAADILGIDKNQKPAAKEQGVDANIKGIGGDKPETEAEKKAREKKAKDAEKAAAKEAADYAEMMKAVQDGINEVTKHTEKAAAARLAMEKKGAAAQLRAVAEQIKKVTEILGSVGDGVVAIVSNLANGIVSVADALVSGDGVFTALADAAAGLVTTIGDVLSQTAEAVGGALSAVTFGLSGPIAGVISTLIKLTTETSGGLLRVFGRFSETLEPIIAVTKYFGDVVYGVAQVIGPIFADVSRLGPMLTALARTFETLLAAGGADILANAVHNVVGMLELVVSAFARSAMHLEPIIALLAAYSNAAAPIVDSLNWMATQIVTLAVNMVNAVVSVIRMLPTQGNFGKKLTLSDFLPTYTPYDPKPGDTPGGEDPLGGGSGDASGNLNLPEAFKLAAARANAIDAGMTGPGTDEVFSQMMIVVYVNGVPVEDIETMQEKRDRMKALANTGVPLTTARKLSGIVKRGNI